jgi:sugar lactone lactonase YvrE
LLIRAALLVLIPLGVEFTAAPASQAQTVSFASAQSTVADAGNFGTANICPSGQSSPAPCSQTLTLNYNVIEGGTLGTPTVLTQGAPNLDFTLAGGSTCSGDVTAGSQCTVNVTFTPRAPGLRLGAVEITDMSGNILANTPLHGIGQGPAIAFGPATLSTVVGGLSGPTNAVAVDAAGNLFFTDANKDRVVKVQAGGAQTAVVTGLNAPQGLAVDGAGDIFVADTDNSRVVKATAGGGALTTMGSGLSFPQGVAVDGAGNVFIADGGNARLVEVPADGGPQTTLFTGLNNPYAVAVDGAGNIFIGDDGNNRVVKLPAGGGAQTTVGTGLSHPRGVAVDGAGDVFIGDDGNNRVLEVPAGGGAQITLSSDLFHPTGVALDGAGNVFTGDLFSRIAELQRSQAPGLTFAATSAGSTSSDSPQSVMIQNIGNAALTETALTVGANFQQVPGSGTPADCTSNFILAPGESCNLSFSFTPQTGGNLQSSAVLTNNALNATAAMQSIILSGTGIVATTTTASAAAGQYSDAVTLSAVVGPSGLTFGGTVQFQVAGVNACTASMTGSGTYTCGYTITQPAGTYAITATLTSTDSSVQGSSGNNTLTVTKEDATVTPSNTNPSTVQVNAAGGTAGPITLRGTAQQAQDGSLGDITKAVVTVNLVPAVSGGPTVVCPVSNTNGALTATCSNLPVDAYTVRWSIGGNYYQAPTVSTVLAVYDPSLGFVTGSGTVIDNGVQADFAISVKYLKNGALSGGVTHVEHRASGDVTVSSTTLSSMSLVGTTAVIYGQATVNGVAGYTLQLNVTDNGTPGINGDRFGLQLSGGTLNPPISFAPVTITAGNIQTH